MKTSSISALMPIMHGTPHAPTSRPRLKLHALPAGSAGIAVACAFLLLGAKPLPAATYTWDAGGGATTTWSEPTNWVGDLAPTFAAGDTFDLTHAITAAGVSTMDSSATLGTVNIIGSANGAFTWTLDRTGSEVLTLNNGTSAAQINTLLTTADNATANTISVPIAITGNLNINNQARAKRLQFLQPISSAAASGTQTINFTGNFGNGGVIRVSGGISDGVAGGAVAAVVNAPNHIVELFTSTNANTSTGGTTLIAGTVRIQNNAFGAAGSSLTIGPTSLAPLQTLQLVNEGVASSTQNLGTLDILGDFFMNAGNFGTINITGATAVNLNNATRTISDGAGAVPVNQHALRFLGSGQTINDGTLRIIGGPSATVTAPVSLAFGSVVTFLDADLEIGQKATTSFEIHNAFGTNPANLPNVTVNADGALNLSHHAHAGATSRNLTIASLSGGGEVRNSTGLSSTATLTINGSTSTTFSGVIRNGGYNSQTAGIVALTKDGSSTLTLTGDNLYTGATTVSAGTLLINGSTVAGSTVSVGASGTLGGTGTIGGATTVAGTLSPGNSTGILTIENNVTITDGGGLAIELNGTTVGSGYDRLALTGASPTFSLTGTNNLALSLDYTPAIGDLFFIVSVAGGNAIAGVFEQLNGAPTDLSQDAIFTLGGFQWQISYTGDVGGNSFSGAGNDLALQVIPEPSAALLAMAGLAFCLCWHRRKH